MNDIHISICVITYNHEGYISKALDSILEQNFNKDKIEIVIGVDKSSDGTSKIVDKYHKKHQKIIYPLYHKKNIGMMANFIDTIKRCKGKYIALCEGDDYWTFNQKLLQQFNFMNSHEQYSFCFHNAIVIHEHCNKETSPFTNLENRDYEGCEVIEEWKSKFDTLTESEQILGTLYHLGNPRGINDKGKMTRMPHLLNLMPLALMNKKAVKFFLNKWAEKVDNPKSWILHSSGPITSGGVKFSRNPIGDILRTILNYTDRRYC